MYLVCILGLESAYNVKCGVSFKQLCFQVFSVARNKRSFFIQTIKLCITKCSTSDFLTDSQPSTNLIVLQAADHELSEDDHSGATHPGATVHHHRWIEAL